MSYNGHLGFGLLGDYDALPELEEIADDLKRSIAELARAAGVRARRGPRINAGERSRKNNNNSRKRSPTAGKALGAG